MAMDLEKDLYIEMMMAESWKEIFGEYQDGYWIVACIRCCKCHAGYHNPFYTCSERLTIR